LPEPYIDIAIAVRSDEQAEELVRSFLGGATS
jgi:hypothetical protein